MKIRITIFFSIIFIAIIAIPTIMCLTNKNAEIALFLNLDENEHEKEKGEESNSKEIKKITSYTTSDFSDKDTKEKCMSFYVKNYISQYPKILTQPPEFLI